MAVETRSVTIGFIGDTHTRSFEKSQRNAVISHGELYDTFQQIQATCQLLALAGDITDHGLMRQLETFLSILANSTKSSLEKVAVLGNHDLHSGKGKQLRAELTTAGFTMLEDVPRYVKDINGLKVGAVGDVGERGGFGKGAAHDFGDPSTRRDFRTVSRSLRHLNTGARLLETDEPDVAFSLMHYIHDVSLLEGSEEAPEVWYHLGSERYQKEFLDEHNGIIDFAVSAHAHYGNPEGKTPGGVKLYNASTVVQKKHSKSRYLPIKLER